jgi:uncharacterized membrane protein
MSRIYLALVLETIGIPKTILALFVINISSKYVPTYLYKVAINTLAIFDKDSYPSLKHI